MPDGFETKRPDSLERRRIYSTEWIHQRTYCTKICADPRVAPWTLRERLGRTLFDIAKGSSMEPIHRPCVHGTTRKNSLVVAATGAAGRSRRQPAAEFE